MSTRRLSWFDGWVAVAMIGLALLVAVAAFGARIAPHEPIVFVVEHGADPRPYDPGLVYPAGSDVLGRDLLSLILSGAGTTLAIVLIAGAARVLSGLAIAAFGSWWRVGRLATEWLAEFVSAVPATLVALVVVKVFVRPDSGILLFVGALLLIGWAGPYRVIRAEIDRLAHAPFTLGARALGVGRWRLLWRHQLPHLVPILAINLSQQVVASLVLIAELGVLGTFVGQTRTINIEESLSRVLTGPVNVAQIADPPEWGGLLANARTIESLWTTRWLVFVPGLAFALTASTIALVGFALGRRYARRDLIADLRGPGAAGLATALIVLVVLGSVLPERYASAREWASHARLAVAEPHSLTDAMRDSGLAPLAGTDYALAREVNVVERGGPATVTAGTLTLTEKPSAAAADVPDADRDVRAFVTATTGGGVIDAPLVYAARGISPDDFVPPPVSISPFTRQEPGFAQLLRDFGYADDYAHLDVRGKVVVLVRFLGIRARTTDRATTSLNGPAPETMIANAIKRGAAAVVFIDPALTLYTDITAGRVYALGDILGGTNPYGLAEAEDPPTQTAGVPVVVLSEKAGRAFAGQLGIDIGSYLRLDERGAARYTSSEARTLDASARVSVPLRVARAVATSVGGATAGAREHDSVILVWNLRHGPEGGDVLAALARSLGPTRASFLLVDFDPAIDPRANAQAIRTSLSRWRIGLVIVLDALRGSALKFVTPYGDLIPAFDTYAARSGARALRTSSTARIAELAGIAPFIDLKTIVVTGATGDGDLRPDAAALIGYVAGRQALGAEEVPR